MPGRWPRGTSWGMLRRTLRSVRQDQVQVAELVPEVAGVQRGTVDPLHVRAPGDRLEQNQVRRLRLMESGEQAVDDLDATLRGDDQEIGRASCRERVWIWVGER